MPGPCTHVGDLKKFLALGFEPVQLPYSPLGINPVDDNLSVSLCNVAFQVKNKFFFQLTKSLALNSRKIWIILIYNGEMELTFSHSIDPMIYMYIQ